MTKRAINFAPGPAMLPLEVLNSIEQELYDWHNGMSVMECSHRSAEVIHMIERTSECLGRLLDIPQGYTCLFVPGGARTQFSAIPLNFLKDKKALYLNTGNWSKQAYKEALRYGDMVEVLFEPTSSQNFNAYVSGVASSVGKQLRGKSFSEVFAYAHYTDNETIEGIEYQSVPELGDTSFGHLPLFCDMTSNLMTKTLDISKFGLIYAAAQKNLGIAGITLVIVKDELLGHANPMTPLMLNLAEHAKSHSLLNTMPVFPMYVMYLMTQWQENHGGIAFFEKRAKLWSDEIYQLIDNSQIFNNSIDSGARSRINIPFQLDTKEHEEQFLNEANALGLINLKGHALAGGIRVSLYLGMTQEGVERLIDFMRAFEKRYG